MDKDFLKSLLKNKWYKKELLSVIFCIAIGLLINNIDTFFSFNQNWIDSDIRAAGLQGGIYFVAISAALTACGAPRQFVAFLGGYAFGFTMGAFLATLATLIGCIIAFYTSRFMLRPLIKRKFSKQLRSIDAFFGQQATRKTIVIRLLPVGSNIITNLLAGTTGVSSRAFFVGSGIGYLPQMIVFALLGKGLLLGSEWKIALSIGMLLVSSFISFSIYKKHKKSAGFISNEQMGETSNINPHAL